MLEKELAHFEKIKEDLLANHAWKFALIADEEFVDAFDTPTNAYAEGVKRFGKKPFLVKRISPTEETYRNQALLHGLLHARL